MGTRSHANSAQRQVVRASLTTVCASLVVSLALVSSLPREVSANDVRTILEQALAQFEEGNLAGAVETFERAFALDPSNDVLYTWMQEVGMSAIFRMISSDDPRLSGIGRSLLGRSAIDQREKRSDVEDIRAAVESAMGATDDRLVQMMQATSDYGRNLAPALIPYLADKELTKRTTAFTWLTRVGASAVPILQAARKHPDAMVRLNVAKLLGTAPLRSTVSLATLKAMMESDESAEVREAAEVAFESVLAGGNRVRAAKEYFVQNAYRYYLKPHLNPFAQSKAYLPTVYSLKGDEVVGERVAGFQLGERMAQQALEEALELDPGFRAAYVVSLCNDCAQVVEFDKNLAYYAEEGADESTRHLLLAQKSYVDTVLRLRILAAPTDVLYRGLEQALEDGRSDVAVAIIQTIRETRRRGDVPPELVRALEDEKSRLVRIAAAVALAEWNPAEGFSAGDMVVNVLSEAVVSSGIRVVQKVMGDRRRANRFDELLRELHMESYGPLESIEEGYVAAINSPPDAVLVDESVRLASNADGVAPVNFFVSQLRRNYRTAGVPVIVAVSEARAVAAKDLYESDERKVYVVSEGIDSLGLKNLVLDRLFGEKDDAKSLATRLAAEAARALAGLAAAPHPLIPVEASVDSLIRVLRDRPDEVRIPCIRALGGVRAADAAGELAVVFADERNSVAVRAAAMTAVGDVLQGSDRSASNAVLSTIRDGMMSADLELRRASWYAFSGAEADGAVRLEAMLASAPAQGEGTEPAAAEPVDAADEAELGEADDDAAESEDGDV